MSEMTASNRATGQLVTCPRCRAVLRLNQPDGDYVPAGNCFECGGCGVGLMLTATGGADVMDVVP